ncbi:hypothetical protein CANARDRAFT_30409 [[Candida] arabinofermentans NRRL YB-2248]|uniref:Cytokinin riboside 5'-monophosphate phosphoribohydrolase n=1 Tax=[Candida] arabinofermentans NRRL YB-2248 TaxID=983967 RepID=A0A1E4STU4_9ASCO|nr:hypothetical protein CANARDRAFT_30409 [[Candida] arabinofermentans NRRL YB-2248]
MKEGMKKTVCVFCGSSYGSKPAYTAAATELGELLAKKNYGLVYGGGTTGLMGTVAKAVSSNGGYVHGIIPSALVTKERADESKIEEINKEVMQGVSNHKGTTFIAENYGKTTIVSDMHTRKKMMGQEADGGFVAMPGGYGTLEEVMEVTTWSQLGIHQKPIILFNIDGFYDKFITFLEEVVFNGFISETHKDIVHIATTAEEVIEKLEMYVAPEGRFNLDWSSQ